LTSYEEGDEKRNAEFRITEFRMKNGCRARYADPALKSIEKLQSPDRFYGASGVGKLLVSRVY